MKKLIVAAFVAGAFMVTSCTNSGTTTVTKGSLSEFDSLSYAVGVNLSQMTTVQLSDLPLNYDVLISSLEKTALGKNKTSHEDATATLQAYFMAPRNMRAEAVKAERDAADSVALANGADQTAVAAARAALPAAAEMFESEAERTEISEALGIDLGNSIKVAKIPAQVVWVKKAFEDALAGEYQLSDNEANSQIQKFFMITLPAINDEASVAWLAGIEKKSGVQKTESGLLYKVEVAGDESVMATDGRDVVKVKYTGKTRTGDVFDSSRFDDMDPARLEYMKGNAENGELTDDMEIIEFPLNRVIPGWTEGMQLVGKGGRISLWIPSSLAYGERGAGASIGPKEALYFDVELVDVTPYEAPAPVEAPAAE